MSQYAKYQLDPYGVVSDANALDVPDDKWNTANNVRFNDNAAEKIGGEVEATVNSEQAYHLQFNGDHLSPLWLWMGSQNVFATDFTTETSIGAASAPNSDWDSTLFNNIPVMNNVVSAPVWWDGSLANPVTTLPAFPVNTLCQAIRPYKSFLIALNIIESSITQENRLIWSDSSDAGALPASWDISDPTTLAGDAYLTSSKGEIIDGLQLRDLFVIYKTHSMYIMRLIQGQSVMKIDKVQVNSGILAKNCVQEFNGIHFVVSDADVVLFDGQSVKTIADKIVRAEIFGNIDTDNYRNAYVTRYDRQNEMWVCFPTKGQSVANRAAIWNWIDDTWVFRDLSQSYFIASGVANFAISDTYLQATYTYTSAQAQVPYAPVASNPTTDTLISASTLKLGIIDQGFDVYTVPMPSILEKNSMILGDEGVIKLIRSVTPQITAPVGTSIFIRIGSQFHPDDPIIYSPEQEYKVGIDRKSDFMVKGRYISIRFRTQNAGDTWKLHGFYFTVAMGEAY